MTSIRDNELAALSNGVDVTRSKVLVYIITAFATATVGALIFLQKLRISPDAAFSVNEIQSYIFYRALRTAAKTAGRSSRTDGCRQWRT